MDEIRDELIQSSLEEILLSSQFSLKLKSIASNPSFWEEKAVNDFGIDLEEFRKTKYSPRGRYIELYSETGITYGSEKYADLQNCLNTAAADNNIALLRYFSMLGEVDLDLALFEACKNDADEARIYLECKGARNWNLGLKGSAKAGNQEKVKYYLFLGATDLDGAMIASIYSLKFELVNFLIYQGARDFNRGLEAAASVGDVDLVRYFIENGATLRGPAYEAAEEKNHRTIMKILKNE